MVRSVGREKKARQVVLDIPAGYERDTELGELVLGPKSLSLLTSEVAVGFIRLDDRPIPLLLARGDGFAATLRGRSLHVAFGFYRMRQGGLCTTIVAAPVSKDYQQFEGVFGLDVDEANARFRDAFQSETLTMCFAEGDGVGGFDGGVFSATSLTARFDIVVQLPPECRSALIQEWDAVLEYHASIPKLRRDFGASATQWQSENPQGESTILPKPATRVTGASGAAAADQSIAYRGSRSKIGFTEKWREEKQDIIESDNVGFLSQIGFGQAAPTRA